MAANHLQAQHGRSFGLSPSTREPLPDQHEPDKDEPEPLSDEEYGATEGFEDTDLEDEVDEVPPRPVWRVALAWVATALASLLVLFGLIAPDQLDLLTPSEFVRLPVEAILGVALLLVLPGKAKQIVAVLLGVILGLVTILKVVDMGFFVTLDRPFDPVLDWTFVRDGIEFLQSTSGRATAIVAQIGAVVLIIAVLALMTLSILRLTKLFGRHRVGTARVTAVFAAIWIICAVFGAQLVTGVPVASTSASAYAYDHAKQLPASLKDKKEFADEVSVDAFRDTPGDQLLTGLRGKDVLLTFVESYGRSAVEDAELAPGVDAVLDNGTNELRAAGFSAKSGFLTSPTYGGGSWLAHSTLLSGVWINNQQRYNDLVSSDRLTLNNAFRRASWQSVAFVPGVTRDWPEGNYFGYDKIYAAKDLGYRGPNFSWSTMSDQYTLSAFERLVHKNANHVPTMTEMPLLSSHAPWDPVPTMVDWNAVGDGSIFNSQAAPGAPPEAILSRDPTRVQANYGHSIQYSLTALISYIKTYGDDNTVLVFLGDHQPAPVVTGENASRDVPITILAKDPAVLDKVSGWGWTDGLKPAHNAPVWPMNAFRDKFLTAFGSTPTPNQP